MFFLDLRHRGLVALGTHVHSTSCSVKDGYPLCSHLPCLGSVTHPGMLIRHFGKGNNQDLFSLLLFLAVTSQIAVGPEGQAARELGSGLRVQHRTNEQSPPLLTCLSCSAMDATKHSQLCVRVRAASLMTGTRGLHTPDSLSPGQLL